MHADPAPIDPIDELEAILLAENAALRRNDPAAAVALLERKLAAAKTLPSPIPFFDAHRLHELATENRQLLERAIEVQGRIIALLVRAAKAAPGHARYGAEGRTLAASGHPTVARQA